MDVKRMHEMIEKLSECAKTQFDKGIDHVDTCEMGKVIDMMKDVLPGTDKNHAGI